MTPGAPFQRRTAASPPPRHLAETPPEVSESANPVNRTLHLASFVLPGPFTEDEIPQQELYDVANGTYEGGESGELTVAIPPHSGTSGGGVSAPLIGLAVLQAGAAIGLLNRS